MITLYLAFAAAVGNPTENLVKVVEVATSILYQPTIGILQRITNNQKVILLSGIINPMLYAFVIEQIIWRLKKRKQRLTKTQL